MAYLKSAKVGQIISVPAAVPYPSRQGASRYDWKPALVRRIFQAKGGSAVEVSLRKGIDKKFLVGRCQKQEFRIPVMEKSTVPAIELMKSSPKGAFFRNLNLRVEDYSQYIKDYRKH